MFVIALFLVTPNWQQPNCLRVDKLSVALNEHGWTSMATAIADESQYWKKPYKNVHTAIPVIQSWKPDR